MNIVFEALYGEVSMCIQLVVTPCVSTLLRRFCFLKNRFSFLFYCCGVNFRIQETTQYFVFWKNCPANINSGPLARWQLNHQRTISFERLTCEKAIGQVKWLANWSCWTVTGKVRGKPRIAKLLCPIKNKAHGLASGSTKFVMFRYGGHHCWSAIWG